MPSSQKSNDFDLKNVNELWMDTTTGRRSKVTRQSRAVDLRSCTLTLTFAPKNIQVRGEIPEGHYSNKQMKKLKEDLRNKLLVKLKNIVNGN